MSTQTHSPPSDCEFAKKRKVDAGDDAIDAESLLSSVSSALEDRANKDIFTLGGKIDINRPSSATAVTKTPLVIRWDVGEGERDHDPKVTFPVDEASRKAFARLVTDCEPATFGLHSEDVLDETYRKAGKIDESKFCTNFCPYEHGVIDTVVQTLVHSTHADGSFRGLRAELYKLNIYSGPSGKFRPHVDTPRSKDQMGSLVVCLPHPHKGGRLAVRHGGREVAFDWAAESSFAIQWAAFFSDCEHEVYEVSEGHRVTLTYNLYRTVYGPASMADHLDALEPESLHFYRTLKNLLDCPTFLPKGGLLGFTCTHAYPHTSSSSIADLHCTLKGLDMVVYQALKRLTGSAQVSAVLDDSKYRKWLEDFDDYSDEDAKPDVPIFYNLCPPILWYPAEDENLPDPCEIDGVGSCPDVTWLNYSPTSNTPKSLAAVYIAYGNEHTLDAYYSSAVIISMRMPFKKSTVKEESKE